MLINIYALVCFLPLILQIHRLVCLVWNGDTNMSLKHFCNTNAVESAVVGLNGFYLHWQSLKSAGQVREIYMVDS